MRTPTQGSDGYAFYMQRSWYRRLEICEYNYRFYMCVHECFIANESLTNWAVDSE